MSWRAPKPAPLPRLPIPCANSSRFSFTPKSRTRPAVPRSATSRTFCSTSATAIRDWDPAGQIRQIEDQIRAVARDRNVFFFVSGGVDSTASPSTLCQRALGTARVRGAYVDTGLMREGETELVRRNFPSLEIVDAALRHPLGALENVTDPERKRHIIGEEFVKVQERVLESDRILDNNWILWARGTIYPDTIESGGSAKADLIKTHHNRVAGIQALIDQGRIVEPLASFYKDEVRAIGRELSVAPELLDRHPFPGPGLAIRCLCSTTTAEPEHTPDGWILPVRSVGVQGDARTYRPVLALEDFPDSMEAAARLTNRIAGVNRVIVAVWTAEPTDKLRVHPASLSPDRLNRLRQADAIVRRLARDFDASIWQFPVVLIPAGTANRKDSVVLRPIDSVDGMTASAVRMPAALLESIVKELREVEGIAGIFYDLTNKPPATIEWE